MRVPKIISSISDEEKMSTVVRLLELIQRQAEKIEQLEDEIKRLKGLKKRPKIKPSKLEKKPGGREKRLQIFQFQNVLPETENEVAPQGSVDPAKALR